MAELSAVTKAAIPATIGSVLSMAHAAGMQSSFPLLQKNYKFSKVLFFGRIVGKAQDYLIALGIENSWTGTKKFFFWCDAPLPPSSPPHAAAGEPTGHGMRSGPVSLAWLSPEGPAQPSAAERCRDPPAARVAACALCT